MKYREWKIWVKSLPWNFRWFVYLVLLRPLIDNFFALKETSIFLSPLYIVGFLTPVLITHTLYLKRMPKKSSLDNLFGFWLFFIIISSFVVLITDITGIDTIASFFKTSLPFFLYYYLRRIIKTERDLDGLLTTTIYSGIFIYSVFLYEILVRPIEIQDTRAGLERIQGFYSDVANYGMYTALIFISVCYFFLKKEVNFKRVRNLILFSLLAILILVKINHAASFFVFGTLFLLFFYFNFKVKPVYGVLLGLLFGVFMTIYISQIASENLDPLLDREVEVLQGEREQDQGLHGRMGRWKGMFADWKKYNLIEKFFGAPFSFDKRYLWAYSAGSHNDYIRILWLTGIIGLTSYFLIIINIFRKISKQRTVDKFLGMATMAMLMLYSISLTPTFYAFVMYFVIAVWAFLAIPKKIVVSETKI